MAGVRVVNKATGEYIDFDYSSFEDFADQYEEITQQIKALERAKKKMADELKIMMGDEEQLKMTDGRYFKKFTSEYKNYDLGVVVRAFDPDELIDLKLIQPAKTRIDELLAEHVEDGGRWEALGGTLRQTMVTDRVTESLRLVKPEGNK